VTRTTRCCARCCPLSLSDARLHSLTQALESIPHVRRLRIHTRLPIVLPSRVDAGLSGWLARLRRPVVIVLHANHANEIDEPLDTACAALRRAGAPAKLSLTPLL
jgi:L-lysine 2,3-aminomutase